MAYTIIPVGSSEPYDFQLKNNGAALNGGGLTVTLEIVKGASVAVVDPPTVAWSDQPNGIVRVLGMEKLTTGTYRVRYKLTDSSARIGYAPNQDAADVWNVVKVSA